ncbi:MAG: hypothetical protein M3Z56_04515, partial [Bacteroidota bacterium]|nr:hypothetical protein [Bacteroidota bacterium]
MCFSQGTFTSKKIFLFLFFSLLIHVTGLFAQIPGEDLPIDPNALKNASPSDLQNFLKDNNKQENKAGEDIHKGLNDLKQKNVIAKDSTQRDDFKRRLSSPEAVYGRDLFQQKQILELSEVSTPPLDYPIGVGDVIVVSLWGGADFEQSYT